MFSAVLIANRGEIAVRAIRTLKRLGVRSIAVYAEPDRNSPHVREADAVVALGGEKPVDNYLHIDKLIAACRQSGAQAVFPGYGFLSESSEFAVACESAGVTFLGPTPEQMREFGLKHRARELAARAGVPSVPGTGLLSGVEEALQHAESIGYPVMLKRTAGGGGIGLSRCQTPSELIRAYEGAGRLGGMYFREGGIYLERYIGHARHIEVQLLGDGQGHVGAFGERDCSVQRRHQKVIEETPAPGLDEATRIALIDAATRLFRSVNYRSAGTVEFLYDAARRNFYFLEVNTRLQVEHPVTEMVTGLDLIELMLRVGAGDALDWTALNRPPRGAAMEVRLYAEDPVRNLQPSTGTLTDVYFPPGVRVDGWIDSGTEVTAHYDPLLAKLIVHGPDRQAARSSLSAALASTRLHGISTNLEYLRAIVADPHFISGGIDTSFLDGFQFQPSAIEVMEPGIYTTVQDYPGRLGFWGIGVPPSGPMDDYAFRLANRIVGNASEAAGLECTLAGPKLRFHHDSVVALTGAPSAPELDGNPVPMWSPLHIKAGQMLAIGRVTAGCRTYLAVRNGIDVPSYLGSRSTFVLGQFGGYSGRTLRAGDMLTIADPGLPASTTPPPVDRPQAPPPGLVPVYSAHWEISVLNGPHGAPDYFTQDAIEEFFAAEWEAHYNSNRLGVRLKGPKPSWSRDSGGEAGLHPSNVHDCVYAVGSINFTGDTPVILARDGPSLGGFVCPVTVASAELWKVGQIKPGDRIRFKPVTHAQASALEAARESRIRTLTAVPSPSLDATPPPATDSPGAGAILGRRAAEQHHPRTVWRQAGDKCILLEYGDDALDLALRLRVHLLMEAIHSERLPIVELAPGVRSLQIRYHPGQISQAALMRRLYEIEDALAGIDSLKLPTRVVHLPMAFEDSATLAAVARYSETVRSTAPWLPSNTEFLRRINGLGSVEDIRDILFSARYMVLGLGDVYLGAPCALPVDPRHRLLGSKYNPARTFTAEGTVGIGGMYMCVYGMDSPGGYQIVGRTLPIWNKFIRNPQFEPNKPWLLRFFDQISFYPVTEEELTVERESFREGRSSIRIDEEIFDWAAHREFLEQHAAEIAEFRARQGAAFQTEVAHWTRTEPAPAPLPPPGTSFAAEIPEGHHVSAQMHGVIWKVLVNPGERVELQQVLLIIEAMKMEVLVLSPVAGVVRSTRCEVGQPVSAGDILAVIQ
jgi:urea carboxylase